VAHDILKNPLSSPAEKDKAMRMLGIDVPRNDLEEIFESGDADE